LETRENRPPDRDLAGPPPDQAAPPDAGPDPEPTVRQWLAQNMAMLAVIAAGLIFLYVKFDVDGLLAIAKAAVGLGFVIFIHELGHFLVAKWCDVHVQTFSIGFGPALPGCRFTWGETTYKLGLIPLGGYVQMVGQVDGDESSDGSEDDPRSYRNKSVWQRMAIISAGVTMNAILAVVCFVVVFLGPGKDRKAGVVGVVDSGGAAFKTGVEPGALILRAGGTERPFFEQLMAEVMATGAHERLPFEFETRGPSGAPLKRTFDIEPRVAKGDMSRPVIGISPASRLTLVDQSAGKVADIERPAWPGTAADRADGGVEFGDEVIATTDPDDPAKVTDLPPDWRKPGSDQRDYFVFARRMQQLAGKEVTLRVRRGPAGDRRTVDVRIGAAFHRVLGARMLMGQIVAVRDRSPAAGTDPVRHVQARNKESGLEGDVIQQVEVTEPDGRSTTIFVADNPAGGAAAGGAGKPATGRQASPQQGKKRQLPLDPERLPYDLRSWAERMRKAKKSEDSWVVTLRLRRHNAPENPNTRKQYTSVVVRLPWLKDWTYKGAEPLAPDSPLAVPELGLAYVVKTTVAAVDRPGAGDDALRPGDVIEKIKVHYLARGGEIKESPQVTLGEDEWARHFQWLQSQYLVKAVTLEVTRNGQSRTFKVALRADQTWPLADRGLLFDYDLRRQKARGAVEAVVMGLEDTRDTMVQVFQNLRGMVTRRISPKNLGGPLTIAAVAYRYASVDFWEFVFFLGLISINLAVINFLPIPVLDGGHMAFLIYEKIRGRPASEQVRVGATYAGLLLLASLMIFVLYLDITRFFKGG
jgi:regulator of sigma E protease